MKLLLVALAACAAAPPPVIRMATKIDEDGWSEPAPRQLDGGITFSVRRCALAGAPAPEQREALIAYARAHLITEIENTGFSGLPVIVGGEPKPRTCYTEIRVEARTQLGEIELVQCEPNGHGGCSWGASVTYCLHVTNEAGKRTIIVEPRETIVGSRASPPRDMAYVHETSTNRR